MTITRPPEQIATKFKAAWNVFAQTCGQFWAPEASYQAWFAHYLISQFGIDRVAREPIIKIHNFRTAELRDRIGGGEVRLDAVVTRVPGILMPHYANRLGKASDESGLGLLKELAVISELKVGATVQGGLKKPALIRDIDKLRLLLTEFQDSHGSEAPLAYLCVLDNHVSKEFDPAAVKAYCDSEAPGVELLFASTESRPPVSADGFIVR